MAQKKKTIIHPVNNTGTDFCFRLYLKNIIGDYEIHTIHGIRLRDS